MTGEHDTSERRLVFRLLTYWRELGGEGSLPSLSAVDADTIPDIWPHCFLLECHPDDAEAVFHSAGKQFASTCGRDLTGVAVSNVPSNSLAEHATYFFEEVRRRMAPICRGGAFADADGITVLYRSVLVPLSDGGEIVNALLGAANCRHLATADDGGSGLCIGSETLKIPPR